MRAHRSAGMTRREALKLGAGGAGMFVVAAGGLAIPRSVAKGGSGSLYIEAFPTSPLITRPFDEALPVPAALRPIPKAEVDAWPSPPGPDNQDFVKGASPAKHQLWPGDGVTATYPWTTTTPDVYQLKVQAAGHDFTSSAVQPIDSNGRNSVPPGSGNANPRFLPKSTIYGFNAHDREVAGLTVFPGPRINAEYARPALVRFENHLDVDNGTDPMDFGSPNRSFITHLHNAHTAAESDGNPCQGYRRFAPLNRFTHEAAYEPGERVDNLYLGYPAGGDDREKQSFFWFHDHVHGHTGANVYKGMVGLMPIYDPIIDNGDETKKDGLRLPGRRRDNGDGSFDVDYDIPLAIYDCRLDDGVTPHKDAHNGSGETHPEWWGKTFCRHFPNHGFVGDLFTVNGKAFPVLEVKRRKYRLRFLDASISRIYDFKLMTGHPKAARDLGYTGDELQGQYRLPDGKQCMKMVEIANDGGLLPKPIVRDNFELWPAKRREVVVDFTKWMDGSSTKPGDELYLVNTMKMTTGRMWDAQDPKYLVPVLKIVIGDDPPEPDYSIIPPISARCPRSSTGTRRRSRTRASRRSSSSAEAPTPTPRPSGSSTASSSTRPSRSSRSRRTPPASGGSATAAAAGCTPCTCTWRSTAWWPGTAGSRPTPVTPTTRGRRTWSRSTPARRSSSPAGSGPSPAATWPTATTSPTRTTA
jgi:hypothetical protein